MLPTISGKEEKRDLLNNKNCNFPKIDVEVSNIKLKN
jgi:hypothetical protein